MKKSLLIFILLQSLNVFCQDSLEINKNWTRLKQQLNLRTEITLEITKQLQKSKKIDKVELKNTELYAQELKLICESNILNRSKVDLTKEKNVELTTSLTRTLVNLEFDTKLKNKEETQSLIDQLLMIETQLCIETNKYNKSCKEYSKEELIFDIKCENEPPKVTKE